MQTTTTTTRARLDVIQPATDGRGDIEGVEHNPGEMIRSWRCRLGVTQEVLARALGVTLSTLNRWENGRGFPSQLAWRELKRFAARRGCPL